MKSKKSYLLFSLKLIFGLAVLCFVSWKGYRAFQTNDFTQISIQSNGLFYGIIAFLLMGLNWSLESKKWQILIHSIQPMTFKSALIAVLAGISTGIITPNRLGNFIGRIAFVEKDARLKATLLTLLSNLAQFVTTVSFGLVGLFFVGSSYFKNASYLMPIIGAVILFFGILIYLKPNRINIRPLNYFIPEKVGDGIHFVSETSLNIKLKIIGISGVRHLVFVTQYVLIISLFIQDIAVHDLYTHIAVVYLLVTLIPSLFFGKLFLREAAALVILSQLGIPDSIILITGFLLWFINIAIPSVIGAFFLIGKK
ncbi:flippase-like domain-containing protein [Crocinitomix sp.]|nr:flippase-like domain-containing protein [Crocinitomix sp.]